MSTKSERSIVAGRYARRRRGGRSRGKEAALKRSRIALVGLFAAVLVAAPAGGASAQTPKRGGTVVLAVVPPEPACLNYLLGGRCGPGTASISVLAVTEAVLETPFDTGAGYAWRPRLVSGVDVRTKPPFTLTYHIQPAAKWSDGVAVTARDFVFTLRALRRFDPNGSREVHRSIRSIREVDAKTIRLVLRPRYADWRSFFGPILPAHVLRNADLANVWTDGIVDPGTGRAIGSGPFLVEKLDRGRELVLRRNPSYWGQHRAHVDRLAIRFGVDGRDLADGFGGGELDVAYGFPPSFLPELRRSGLAVSTSAGASFDHFAIRLRDGGHPALHDRLVRQALAYGFDRVALAQRLFADVDPRVAPMHSAVYLNRSPSYRPNWSGYSFQPARARRLLERAGCRRGVDGIYVCAGERLSIRVSSPFIPGSFRARALELVQPQLRQVGIELVPTFFPSRALFDQVLRDGDFEMAIFAWTSSSPSPFGKAIYGCGAQLNWTAYCQRLVTADLDQAERILDATQRARVMNRADAQIAKDVPVIPLYQTPVWAVSSTELRGYVPPASPAALLNQAENWWLDD